MKCKWIGITVLAYLCALVDGIASNSAWMENLPGYAVISGIEQLNTTQCRVEMEQYRDAINQRVLWSLTMLDSSGQPSSGYIMGDNYWMGSKSQCEYLSLRRPINYPLEKAKNISLYRNPADEFPPFTVNFFGAYIRNNGTMQYRFSIPWDDVIILGLCLPDSCSEYEVATMLNKVFDDKLLSFGHLYSTDFELIKVSNLKQDYAWLSNGKIKLIIVFLGALFGSVIVGTLYDIFFYQKRLRKLKKCRSNENIMTELDGDTKQHRDLDPVDGNLVRKLESEAKLKEDMDRNPEHNSKTVQNLKPRGRIEQILMPFSIISNMKQLFQLKASRGEVTTFHGIRFFCASWVLFCHIIYYTIGVAGNKKDLHVKNNLMQYQLFVNSVMTVDIFFFIAGFLLSAGHFRSQRNGKKSVTFRENLSDFLIKIIKRYIRLTPAYVVTMMLSILIFSWSNHYMKANIVEPIPELCLKYWWRNILYIHNLFDWNKLCMTWSWHISNDMQFHIFCTFILKLSVSHYNTAMRLSIVSLILSMLSAAYATYDTGHVKTLDSTFETFSYVYIRPWIRIVPHMLAMGTALFLEKCNYKLYLSKKVLAVGWSISILFCFLVLHGPGMITTSNVGSIIYETFGRLGWNLAVAWVVVVCLTDNAASLNKFLSLPCWIPLSRVSYYAYLLNPIFIILMGVLSDHTLYDENYLCIVLGVGAMILSFVFAFILGAVIEEPTKLLVQTVISLSTKKK